MIKTKIDTPTQTGDELREKAHKWGPWLLLSLEFALEVLKHFWNI